MNKKILILADLNMKKKGGAESFFVGFTEECNKRGLEISFLLPRKPIEAVYNALIKNNAKIIIIEGSKEDRPLDILRFALKVSRFISKGRYDLITFHFYDEVVGFLTILLTKLKLNKAKLIWHQHNELSSMEGISKLSRFLKSNLSAMRTLSLFLDKIGTVSDEVRRQLILRKVPSHKVVTLHNGIDLARFDNLKDEKPDFLNLLGKKDIVITTIVNHRKEKGLEFILKAMQDVLKVYSNAKLVIAGDKALTPELRKLTEELKIEKNIIPLGLRNDIPAMLSNSDIYVQPSLRESFSFSVLEAMAASKPVVASKVGGIPELIENNKNGFLVPPANPKALAEAIIKLIENKEISEEFARDGRVKAEEKFTVEKTIDRYFMVYSDYLGQSNKRKILFVEFSTCYGGSGQALLRLLKVLDKDKFKPAVIYSNRGVILDKIEDMGIKTAYVNYKEFRYAKNIPKPLLYFLELLHFLFVVMPNALRIYSIAKREKIDLFHLNNNILVNMPGIIAGRLKNVPVVTYIRCTRQLTSIERLFANFVDKFSVLTNSAKKLYSNWIPDIKIEVVNDGIYLAPLEDDFPNRIKVSRNGGGVVGIVGRIVEGKGHDDFLTAASIVTKVKPHAKFLIVGSDPTGRDSLEIELRQASERMHLGENVIFTGWRNDVLKVIAELDILIQATSTFPEGSGLTCIEAMALGKPVIATKIPGPSEIVVDNETGFLIPPKSPEAMADKILTLLDNKELAVNMGEAGRKRVKELFDIRKVTKQLEDVYEEVLNNR